MKQQIDRILISRTDNIGDVVLTLPLAALLKQQLPKVRILFLGRAYVKDMVQACPHIDQFICWDELSQLPFKQAKEQLKSLSIDSIIHAFPRKAIARLAKAAGIPQRIGTSRRWYHHCYCNERIAFTRAKSNLHEAQLNLKLLKPFGLDEVLSVDALKQLTAVHLDTPLPEKLAPYLDQNRFNLIIHALSNGNGREWPPTHYCELIQSLPTDTFNVILTGSPAEAPIVHEQIAKHCPNAVDSSGQLTLHELILLLQYSDGIVVSGTGPLHMAAALGTHALGLFPPKPGLNPDRWGPVGRRADFLVSDKNCTQTCSNKDCACMREITPSQVKAIVSRWAAQKQAQKQESVHVEP